MTKNFFKKNNKKKFRIESGFTIIETMIAVALFLIIVTIGMDALLNTGVVHQKSQDMRSIMDNLSFTMEDMSRSLRTGYNYHCVLTSGFQDPDFNNPQSCHLSGSRIYFEKSGGRANDSTDQWGYAIGTLNSDPTVRIYKTTNGGGVSQVDYIPLTSDDIDIDPTASNFTVLGAEAGDHAQPFVIIRLVGTITSNKGVKTPFSLQTSVSQRQIDS